MILKKLSDSKTFKKEIIKAKIISAEGSVPRNKGAFMLVSKKNIYGSIGGGQLEFRIVEISNGSFHDVSSSCLQRFPSHIFHL